MTYYTECLDVAVDHRIRRLFKAVPDDLTNTSDHVSILEARGRLLERPNSEIYVTMELAGPPLKGGIAVSLQQPRDNHPFEDGLDAVIQDCGTLKAINDLFYSVSCGSLDIHRITIIDLLPFVSTRPEKTVLQTLKRSLDTSMKAIDKKEPKVLLCAGKILPEYLWQLDDPLRDLRKYMSLGVGKKFKDPSRVQDENERSYTPIKVNGFHPGYAINHMPCISILRQLQFLICAEACGVLRGDWKEEKWMRNLREDCQKINSNDHKCLQYYIKLYCKTLRDLETCLKSLISDSIPAQIHADLRRYDRLLDSRLSKLCNDISLILGEMFRLQSKGWYGTRMNVTALEQVAIDTSDFAERLEIIEDRHNGNARLIEIMRDGAVDISKSVVRRGEITEQSLDLKTAKDAFLKIAIHIEQLLGDLLMPYEVDNVADLLESMTVL